MDSTDILGDVIWILLLGVLGVVLKLFSGSRSNPRHRTHVPPQITRAGTGIKRGLTAVEAAVLLGRPVDTVLTMILFGVLKKGAARILSANPLGLEVAQPLPDGLHDYEVDFLKAIGGDQAHWAIDLKWTMVRLVKAVSNKVRDFSRAETVNYYRGVVEEAWQEVQAAATPEVKSQKFDEKMDWALLDGNFSGRSAEALGTGPLPVPGWWERYTPLIQSTSNEGDFPTVSAGPDWPAGALPELPGADFAASIADGVQSFSAAAIGDVQHFASEIASQTGLLITESSGEYDGGHDGGHEGGHDSWFDSLFDGGHDGGDSEGYDGGDSGGYDGGDSDWD